MGCPVRWSGVIVSGVVAAAVAVLMSDGETPTATQAAQSSPSGATVNPASCGPVALPKPGVTTNVIVDTRPAVHPITD